MGRIRIGVSGWNYSSWRGSFYPETVRRRDELAHAAERFDTIEVNATFYRLASAETFRRWYQAAPPGFVFSVKGSRFITHNKKLRGVEGPLANYLASGILELGDKLGPILWQLPPRLRIDAARLEPFLAMLPRNTDEAAEIARRHDERVRDARVTPLRHTRRLRHVLELREPESFRPEIVRIARAHGVALAFSHARAWPYTEEITAGFVYVRLHGPDETYASEYGDEGLRRWAARVRAWSAGGEPADAERITDLEPPARKGRDVYVYFDNDQRAIAPREAESLAEIVSSQRLDRPRNG